MVQVCVCEENYNGYARCRNKNCTKFYPFSFPKMASTETGKECTCLYLKECLYLKVGEIN